MDRTSRAADFASEAGDLQALPPWLSMPAESSVLPPPVNTLLQTLPFAHLDWRDFERLCLRVARLTTSGVERCRLFGVRGQAQEGVDFFLKRRGHERYTVVQCKRIDDLTAGAITELVTKFIDGSWASRSEGFVFCTSFDASHTKLAEQIEIESKRLEAKSITFDLWDQEELSLKLKDQPEIVIDFFGHEYAKSFCPTYEAQTKRLDARELRQVRSALLSFYEYVFDDIDPGIPIPRQYGVKSVPLRDRYVGLDVIVAELGASRGAVEELSDRESHGGPGRGDTTFDEASDTAARFDNDMQSAFDSGGAAFLAELNEKSKRVEPDDQRFDTRLPLIDWLTSVDRAVILGPPGSGKSTALRFIAVDLLSDSPQTVETNRKWAGAIPIVVPFAFWTRALSEGTVNLEECLRRWLSAYSQEELFGLVQGALSDSRLLLLVDGLDEWHSEKSGQVALHLLRVFADTSKTPIVVTSRPYALGQLHQTFGEKWAQASIAPLSVRQRAQLCEKWFSIKRERDSTDSKFMPEPAGESDRFLNGIDSSADMRQLATEPMFLSVLLFLWFQGKVLPQNRFDAYDRLLHHIVLQHPVSREQGALKSDSPSPLSLEQVELILAWVALVMQEGGARNEMPLLELQNTVAMFLRDETLGFMMTNTEARAVSHAFSIIAEQKLGILIRESPGSIGFLHRSFREYLAAKHLARTELAYQLEIVRRFGSDARWREVILSLCWLIDRAADKISILEGLQRFADEAPAGLYIHEMIAELAIGEFKLPMARSRKIVLDVLTRIERHGWLPHRKRLLSHVLAGLRSSANAAALRERCEQWIFAVEGWRSALYGALTNWRLDDDLQDILTTAIYDEDEYVKRAAARTLAEIGRSNSGVLKALCGIARAAPSPLSRAAALEALSNEWNTHDEVGELLHDADSASKEMRLVAVAARVRRGIQDKDDLKFLLALLTHDRADDVARPWQHLVVECLVDGWPLDSDVLEHCINGLEKVVDNNVNREMAILILARGYVDVPRAIDYVVRELGAPHPFAGAGSLDTFRRIAEAFGGHEAVKAALDIWLKRDEVRHLVPDAASAAIASKSEFAKERMLQMLAESFPHWPAYALLRGWGMEDAEVALALTTMARSERAHFVSGLIPEILPAQEAETSLRELARNYASILHCRVDFIIRGLGKLAHLNDRDDVIQECITAALNASTSGMLDISALDALFEVFGADGRVLEVARTSLTKEYAPLSSIAAIGGGDPMISMYIRKLLRPLPRPLRIAIVEGVAALEDTPWATGTLSRYRLEREDDVHVLASAAYWRLQRAGSDEVDLAPLETDLNAMGPQFATRRRGAMSALIALEAVPESLLRPVRSGQQSPLGVGISEYFAPNIPFAQVVAQAWEYLNEATEGNIEALLSGPGDMPFWESIALVAMDHKAAGDQLLDCALQMPVTKLSANVLRFLGRALAGSEQLRDLCLRVLMQRGYGGDVGFSSMQIAAQILSRQFANDPDIPDILVSGGLSANDDSIVECLCFGWPKTAVLQELFAGLRRPGPMASARAQVALIATCADPKELLAWADEAFTSMRRFAMPLVSRAFIARMSWDDEASSLFEEHALAGQLDSSTPRILRAAGVMSDRLSSWCLARLSDWPGVSEQLGFDIVAGGVRPVNLSMLDAIG